MGMRRLVMQLVKPLVRFHEPAPGSREAVRICHAISNDSLGRRQICFAAIVSGDAGT